MRFEPVVGRNSLEVTEAHEPIAVKIALGPTRVFPEKVPGKSEEIRKVHPPIEIRITATCASRVSDPEINVMKIDNQVVVQVEAA